MPLLRMHSGASPATASLVEELLTMNAMPSEPLVMLPFLAVGISISGMQREPNVCQPEWKNGPSALCWALTSSPEMAAK